MNVNEWSRNMKERYIFFLSVFTKKEIIDFSCPYHIVINEQTNAGECRLHTLNLNVEQPVKNSLNSKL